MKVVILFSKIFTFLFQQDPFHFGDLKWSILKVGKEHILEVKKCSVPFENQRVFNMQKKLNYDQKDQWILL